jgi:hypothetical protein
MKVLVQEDVEQIKITLAIKWDRHLDDYKTILKSTILFEH